MQCDFARQTPELGSYPAGFRCISLYYVVFYHTFLHVRCTNSPRFPALYSWHAIINSSVPTEYAEYISSPYAFAFLNVLNHETKVSSLLQTLMMILKILITKKFKVKQIVRFRALKKTYFFSEPFKSLTQSRANFVKVAQHLRKKINAWIYPGVWFFFVGLTFTKS